MKFSDNTIAILKNFSTISSSMQFKPGRVQRTNSPSATFLAEVILDDEIEDEFCIYELPRFLQALNMFKTPELKLKENKLVISSGKKKIYYTVASPDTIPLPLEDEIELPESFLEIDLSEETIQEILKAVSVFKQNNIAFVADGKTLSIQSYDVDRAVSDTYKEDLQACSDVYKVIFNKEDFIRIYQCDYKFSLYKDDEGNMIGYLKTEDGKFQYWIGVHDASEAP